MSAAQQGIWIAHQMDTGGALHNFGGYIEIRGGLDEGLLAEAVRRSVAEADALRVRFREDGDGIPQQYLPEAETGAELRVVDLHDESNARRAAERWMKDDLATAVDLLAGPLFAHALLRIAPDHHLFYFRYHHIVLDGYGQVVHWRRLAEMYTALAEGRPARPRLSGTLADLLTEDQEYRGSEQFAEDEAYWLTSAAGQAGPLTLADGAADPAAPPGLRTEPLLRIARASEAAGNHGTHWSGVALAATAAYLHRVTQREDVVIGLPVRARSTRTALTTPGMLANVLPLRLTVRSDMEFGELVQQVSTRVSELLKHQRYRGEELHRQLRRTEDGSADTPGVLVNVVTFDGEIVFGGLRGTVHQLPSGPVRDVLIEFFGGNDGSDLRVAFDGNPDLHDEASLAGHRRRFAAFFDTVTRSGTSAVIGRTELLTSQERARLLGGAAPYVRDYDLGRTLHELVEEQAERTPDAVAATVEGASLSYRELVEQARALAARLRAQGVVTGDVVGVHGERSLDLVVSLLAVLSAGAAYLPLDPELPASRLAFQIEDSAARVVLSRSDLAPALAGTAAEVIAVDRTLPDLPGAGPLPDSAAPGDSAYVIYTSGSTGRPKGVAVPHRGVVNRLLWMQEEYGLQAHDRVLQKTPFTFDVSVWEFFWPLLTGASMHLAAPGAQRDPRALADAIRDHGISTVHFVPSMLDLFLAEPAAAGLASLRRVVCSGEALRPETVGRFFEVYGTGGAPGTASADATDGFTPADRSETPGLYNLYGPTEASIDVTHWRCRPEDAAGPVPIGRPVANTSLYVLDTAGRPLPFGVPGELHIGGVQVASGYVNRPDLTDRSFVPNPFGPGRLYRTGDLAVMREDGVLVYRGRLDHQVKVHGFRIEPGEIESALLSHPAVARAAVTAPQDDAGQRRLVAHVVSKGAPASDAELTDWLRERLPAYMVPAHFTRLDALPLLPNGKLDTKALPLPAPRPAGPVAARPGTAAEQLLHDAWCVVLGLSEAGIDDSFFALGGDSMHAIRVRAELERHGHTFDVAELFRDPSVRELARCVRPLADGDTPARTEPFALLTEADRALLPEGLDDAYPLSAMQAGMLFHAAFSDDSSVYRVVTSVRVAGVLDLDTVRAAVQDTFRRHPSLRCSFDLARYSEPLQLVHRDVTVPVDLAEDLGALSEEARRLAIEGWVERAKFTDFDPGSAPLLKFAVHPCGPDAFQLSVIEHHVVLDGWSDMRMLEEIVDHYRARLAGAPLALPEVASTYRDFVAAERAALASEESRAYWAELLRGVEHTPLAARTAADDAQIGASVVNQRYDVPLSAATADTLRTLARREALPLKSLLVTAHLAVLRLVSGGDEVLTGVVANGRLEERGGDESIGVFLNTLPLRLDLSEATLVETARRVFDHERLSMAHRRYPYAQMQHDVGDALRLDSYVNFMDFHLDGGNAADGAPVTAAGDATAAGAAMTVTVGVAETNYPLAVNFLVEPERGALQLWLDCDLAVLPEEFCDRLAGYYEQALVAVARRPESPAAADLRGEEERALLARWNDTAVAYDPAATVHRLFEERARSHPDAAALAHRDEEVGYGELELRANRLAHHLAALGVTRGDLVGVSLRRGIDLVVALLAVMKAGAAYVPMDPSFPRGRLENIATDAGISCLVKGPGTPEGITAPREVDVVADAAAVAGRPGTAPLLPTTGEDAAYVIYTSGSTGKPKGTEIRHRNAVNFFAGMDERVGCGPQDVVLAVTSVSFDISVLELLWPLTLGAKVVVAGERIINNLVQHSDAAEQPVGFSLFFFAASAGVSNQDGYRLVVDAARFADRNGFEAVWTPERHFNAFGGLYPNPSVMSAALATVTERIALRSGSVVAPLHDTVRIAEEWSLVDNLSNGRVGLAFAAGWNSNDFALQPDRFADRKQRMSEQIEEFRTLWSGGSVRRTGGSGESVDVRIFPAPVQAEPPIWLTSVGTVRTFQKAGASGANLLTHLLGQAPADLAEKIKAYRLARQEAGHADPGQVTVMVHTFMSDDTEYARKRARAPFRDYLLSSTELWRTMFASTGRDFPEMDVEEQLEAVIDLAIDRYFETSGLFGSPETCAELIRSLATAGVDEVACLVDFGLAPDEVLESLTWVDKLRDAHQEEVVENRHSLAQLCRRHSVTLLQGTPSLLTAVAAEPAALESLHGLRALLVGGEAFPSGLAQRLLGALPDVRVFNMYGPTETTIWSTVHLLDRRRDADAENISIGRPIANTTVRVGDARGHEVPVGVSGELWIGGGGVAARYIGRPELTAERFVEAPGGGRFYRTGDRARWRADGRLEFLGRVDRQVKILGHRVEPDEVESVISRHPQLDAVAVTAVEGVNGAELVAYVSPAASLGDTSVQEAHVRRWSEVWEEAYTAPGEDSGEQPEFAGWLSSYTGEPIPEAEMREWLGHTVERIRALEPTAVADVGVGVGLVLRSLAEEVEEYHGLDISEAALKKAAACLGAGCSLPEYVRLRQSGPEYLAVLAPGSLDTVVINSVAQYFPGTDYLRTVLTDAVRAVRPGGAVFIGDVRSVELLPQFHTAVQLHRAGMLSTAEEIRSAIGRQSQEERELCLSPDFFRRFAAECEAVGEVRVELKRGRADNELTAFRYDVTLMAVDGSTVAVPATASAAGRRTSWSALPDGLESLRERLAADTGPLTVTGIPNQRLTRTAAAVRALAAIDGDATVWDLERVLWDVDDSGGVHPEDVIALAARTGRSVRTLVGQDGRLDLFDAVFTPDAPSATGTSTPAETTKDDA
ncbi:D-alanine--poly(phosphoribitol) ligase subunit DltA [Streptomyces sp. NPDC051132]|uniref:D-alanine--poly(phosphoribitol) ligase subunit DltA n=1 Tax=unclassified Streptomyces TaxID=2593676 RepID=UPI003423FE73